ncbi:MAG: hypothetical protein ACPGVU_06895, partial [Limisphaerales bacterium]
MEAPIRQPSNANVTCDDNDRITADTYDDNGNTTIGSDRGAEVRDEYDFENCPIRRRNSNNVILFECDYDHEGNRIRKRRTGVQLTTYHVDTQNPTGYRQARGVYGVKPADVGGKIIDAQFKLGTRRFVLEMKYSISSKYRSEAFKRLGRVRKLEKAKDRACTN